MKKTTKIFTVFLFFCFLSETTYAKKVTNTNVVKIQNNNENSQNLAQNPWDYFKNKSTFQIPNNPRIERERNIFLKNRTALNSLLKSIEPFMILFANKLEQNNIPIEFVLLPILESRYNPTAISPAKAEGLWQIMPATAAQYNKSSHKSAHFDPRLDIIESTQIAFNLLKESNKRFKGDWLLTMAAYNCGAGCVNKQVTKNKNEGKSADYWSLSFPKETMRYVPKVFALVDIIKNNRKYGVKLPNLNHQDSLVKVTFKTPFSLHDISKQTNISLNELKKYNSGYLLSKSMPGTPKHLLVKKKHITKINQLLAKNGQINDPTFIFNQNVKKNQLISSKKPENKSKNKKEKLIAKNNDKKYESDLETEISIEKNLPKRSETLELVSVKITDNIENISIKKTISEQENIKEKHDEKKQNIPHLNDSFQNRSEETKPNIWFSLLKQSDSIDSATNAGTMKIIINYVTKKDDSLKKIAEMHNISIVDLINWNNLESEEIKVGTILKIYI